MKSSVTSSILILAAAGILLFFAPIGWANDEMTIEINDGTAYGSGASSSDDLYTPGGDANVGLFVGNPNTSMRNDRAIFQFDTEPLLLKAKKIEKAELIFWIDYYSSPADKLAMEVERLRLAPDSLSGQQLNDPDAESCGFIEIEPIDALNDSSGRHDAMEKRIDVTEPLKTGLEDGLTTATFRFRVPEIEGQPVLETSNGLIIAAQKNSAEKKHWPILIVTLED